MGEFAVNESDVMFVLLRTWPVLPLNTLSSMLNDPVAVSPVLLTPKKLNVTIAAMDCDADKTVSAKPVIRNIARIACTPLHISQITP